MKKLNKKIKVEVDIPNTVHLGVKTPSTKPIKKFIAHLPLKIRRLFFFCLKELFIAVIIACGCLIIGIFLVLCGMYPKCNDLVWCGWDIGSAFLGLILFVRYTLLIFSRIKYWWRDYYKKWG